MIIKGRIIKTFYFQREENNQMVTVDQEVDERSEVVNLSNLFEAYCPLRYHLITVYHPFYNNFIGLNSLSCQEGCLGRQILEPNNILIRFRNKDQIENDDSVEEDMPRQAEEESDSKNQKRSKERTIGQVLDLVKKWRSLHKTCYKNSNKNKKINYQESAKLVGISKKSLDDYYSQLRLAQKYGFDFTNNLEEKIGKLRLYVKENKEKIKKETEKKTTKLPKHLKIIQSDTFDQNTASSRRVNCKQKEKIFKMEKILSKMIPHKRSQYFNQILNTIQRQFYKDYEVFISNAYSNDPFVVQSKNPLDRQVGQKQQKTNQIYIF